MLKNLKLYYVIVSLPFVMLLIGAAVFVDGVRYTIERNPHPQINYIIFLIILFGGVTILFNSRRLMREAKTIVDFSRAIHTKTDLDTLKNKANSYSGDLACITQMVAASGDRAISHQEQAALEHELANVRNLLNRRNALPNYLTGLLVGMGLLGTFIGLLATLNDISVLITSFSDLDMANVNPIQVFGTMIDRMKAPMQSMAIAFSASMYGLLGSIILGLMMVGLRRMQGDIFSLLSSEVARHIEIALSFESIGFRNRETAGVVSSTGDLTTDILIRIEERLAESSRVRQRALSAEIDDFKKQRADMLRALTEQTEANNGFRGELQHLGSQLGNVISVLESGNSGLTSQVSDLNVNIAGEANKTHKLLTVQLEEQKGLRAALDSYRIDERLAESAKLQQRALTTVIDDLKEQRADMLRTLAEQIEASNNFRGELQQLSSQLGNVLDVMEKGDQEIANQLSELTVQVTAGTKQSQILLNKTTHSLGGELQKLGENLSAQLGTLASITESGNGELSGKVSELTAHLDSSAAESVKQLDNTGITLRSELQQLGSLLGNIISVTDKANNELSNQVSGLRGIMDDSAKESLKQLDNGNNSLRTELQKLGSQLDSISQRADIINNGVSEAGNSLRNELMELGSRLESIANITEKGNAMISGQLSELPVHMAAAANEPPKLPANPDEQLDS